MTTASYTNFIFKIIFFIELFWLSIDTISGYLTYYYHFTSFALIIRIIIFGILFIFLLKYQKLAKLQFFIFSALIVFTLLQIYIYGNLESLKMIAKIFFPIMLYTILYIQIKNNKLSFPQVKKIIILNSIILLINQYLFYFNIGFDSYGIDDNGILNGGTGFFFAGNEVGATLIIVFSLFLIIYYKSNLFFTLSTFLIFLGAALALMSKTAIFGVIIIFILYISSKYNKLIILTYISFLMLFTALYFSTDILEFVASVTSRWTYFYDEYGMIYLLGGVKRWTMVMQLLNDFNQMPLSIIIGKGWSGNNENNFFDLFEAYGILGIIIYILWLGAIIKLRKKSQELLFSSNVFMLLIFISFFAGHVVQSAMLALFAAFLAQSDLIMRMKKNENINNK